MQNSTLEQSINILCQWSTSIYFTTNMTNNTYQESQSSGLSGVVTAPRYFMFFFNT